MPAVVLYHCTFQVLCSKIKSVFFNFCLFFMYYLCEQYYNPVILIAQYYIDDCVNWVPRLILFDL